MPLRPPLLFLDCEKLFTASPPDGSDLQLDLPLPVRLQCLDSLNLHHKVHLSLLLLLGLHHPLLVLDLLVPNRHALGVEKHPVHALHVVMLLLLQVLGPGQGLLVAEELEPLRLGRRHPFLPLLLQLKHLLLPQLGLSHLFLPRSHLGLLYRGHLLWAENVRATPDPHKVGPADRYALHALDWKRGGRGKGLYLNLLLGGTPHRGPCAWLGAPEEGLVHLRALADRPVAPSRGACTATLRRNHPCFA